MMIPDKAAQETPVSESSMSRAEQGREGRQEGQGDEAGLSLDPMHDQGVLADLGKVTPETFEPYVGDVFHVTHRLVETLETHVRPLNDGEVTAGAQHELVELELSEVTRFPWLEEREGGTDHRPREPFALLFEGPPDPVLMSAQLRTQHSRLGSGRLFLNEVMISLHPPAERASKRFYEVVFG